MQQAKADDRSEYLVCYIASILNIVEFCLLTTDIDLAQKYIKFGNKVDGIYAGKFVVIRLSTCN